MSFVQKMDRFFYPDHQKDWDNKLFREQIKTRLSPDAIVLDIGAGAGIVAEMNFKADVGRIYGIDLDPRVVDNPYLHEGCVGDAADLPYADNMFDLIFADNVMEHLANPEQVFRECARVLKPGGILMFKTPNKTHYMPIIAQLTPHSFHQFINNLRGRDAEDTFPTLYRANSKAAVQRLASRSGLELHSVRRIEGRPEYLRFVALTYLFGILYERIVNLSKAFAAFRILLVVELQKP